MWKSSSPWGEGGRRGRRKPAIYIAYSLVLYGMNIMYEPIIGAVTLNKMMETTVGPLAPLMGPG